MQEELLNQLVKSEEKEILTHIYEEDDSNESLAIFTRT